MQRRRTRTVPVIYPRAGSSPSLIEFINAAIVLGVEDNHDWPVKVLLLVAGEKATEAAKAAETTKADVSDVLMNTCLKWQYSCSYGI